MGFLSGKSLPYCIAVGVILIFCAAFFLLYRDFRSNPPNGTIAIRYSLLVQNTTNLPIKGARISVDGPVAHTATQHCQNIQSSYPYTVQKNNPGNQSLAFQWEIFPPLSTKVITIQSEIQIWDHPRRDKIYTVKDFLQPEPFIESGDSRIRFQAARLKGRTALQTVENIYDWVSTHIAYRGYVSRNRGAAYALKYGQGDCTEYAFLFVALCRANGIPARPLAGFVCPQSMVVDFSDYHNWAEFYLDGRWHIADPQYKNFMKNKPFYVAFQNIRPSNGLNGFLIGKIEGQGLEVRIKPKNLSVNRKDNRGGTSK